jgi:hypothetical protein
MQCALLDKKTFKEGERFKPTSIYIPTVKTGIPILTTQSDSSTVIPFLAASLSLKFPHKRTKPSFPNDLESLMAATLSMARQCRF